MSGTKVTTRVDKMHTNNNKVYMQTSNSKRNTKKKRCARRKMTIVLGIVFLLLLALLGTSVVVTANAKTEQKRFGKEENMDFHNNSDVYESFKEKDSDKQAKRYKYYTNVYVTRDMTLWSIAEEYITEEYSDIRAYIDEVMKINQLKSDKLSYGSTICVPYYSGEYK